MGHLAFIVFSFMETSINLKRINLTCSGLLLLFFINGLLIKMGDFVAETKERGMVYTNAFLTQHRSFIIVNIYM